MTGNEVILIIIVTFLSGETYHQGYAQPNYDACKITEGVYHYKFAKREDLHSLVTSCGKQYRIIYWRKIREIK